MSASRTSARAEVVAGTATRTAAAARHGHREVELGDVEAGLELDEEAGGGLLADAGHEAQRAEVVLGEHLAQRHRRVDREDGQRQRGADPVRPEQGLEADALVAGLEPVERLGVLATVVVDEEEDVVVGLAERRPRWPG